MRTIAAFIFASTCHGAVASDYNWAYTNGGAFRTNLPSVGAQSVSVVPCPAGLPGQIHISGGVGIAETVARTGGTCVSGGAYGTLEFVTTRTHSGLFTMRSATDGAQEFYSVIRGEVCPVVALGDYDYTFHGTLTVSDCVSITAQAGASISAFDVDSPAISAVYAGVNSRTLRVSGPLVISSIGTHVAGSTSMYAEGWVNGGISGITCHWAYRCVDWYANNSGGGNPITISSITSNATINTAVMVRSAGSGHTAGFIDHIYADGPTATGLHLAGQTAGWTINHLWIQSIGIGVTLAASIASTVNEINISGPCLIDGPRAAGVNITSPSLPGTNAVVVSGCLIQSDSGAIPIVTSNVGRMALRNNVIYQAGQNYAIAVIAGDHTDITGNIISFGNQAGTAYGIGLVTNASKDVRISSNTLRRVSGAGLATGLVFHPLVFTAVDYCDNRFFGLTVKALNMSLAGVTVCGN